MISKKDVQHIAKLARLGLTPSELGKFRKELSAILDYFKELKNVDTSGVEPCFHAFSMEALLRQDEVKEEPVDSINKLLESAPEKKQRYVKVKAVL